MAYLKHSNSKFYILIFCNLSGILCRERSERMMKKQNWADAVEAIYHQKELLDTAMCSYGENVYDQIIKRFFRCSLAPIEQGKIEVHLLFLRNISSKMNMKIK